MNFWTIENVKRAVGGVYAARPVGGGVDAELTGFATDSRKVKPGNVFFALKGETFDGHAFVADVARAGAGMIVLHDDAAARAVEKAGTRCVAVKVEDTGEAFLRLAGAYRRTLETTRVIAIGGSNGKTTTVRLVAAVLSSLRGSHSAKSFNNAVGVPLTVLAAKKSDQYLICEVGTNAPGELAVLAPVVEPDIAVITSLGREHLEGLGSLEGVAREEATLAWGVKPGGTVIVTADAPLLLDAVAPHVGSPDPLSEKREKRTLVTFGEHPSSDVRITDVVQNMDGVMFTINGREHYRVPLLGLHNAANAAAAVAVGKRLGLDPAQIAAGLLTVKGPEMRLERAEHAGVRFINDAYNANPESMLSALDTFAACVRGDRSVRRRVVVLGDMLEQGAHAPELHLEVAEAVAKTEGVDLVVLVGAHFAKVLAPVQARLGVAGVMSLSDLADSRDRTVAGLLKPGDAVLLKGSRSMGIERVMNAWIAMQSGASSGPVVEGKSPGGVVPVVSGTLPR